MIEPNIVLVPRRPALLAGFDNTVELLVRVQSPATPPPRSRPRTPLNLALVIDRSGSMSGAPLAAAKRCAQRIVDRLDAGDHLSVVAYDNGVQVLVPAQPVRDREAIRRAIETIESGGSTDLHAGWLKGAEQLARLADSKAISRVLLLSDGCANHGLTDIDAIAAQCAEVAAAGVSTSTYGLGSGFNEELMIRMAQAGQGKSYYGETAEDLIGPFEEEFELLSALCARRLVLNVSAAPGVQLTVENRYLQSVDGGYQLPDLPFGGESWALIRFAVPKALAGSGGGSSMIELARIGLRYQDMDGNARTLQVVGFQLPSVPITAWHALAEDSLAARRAQELEAARIQDAAESAARHGDWSGVKIQLALARSNADGNEWLGAVVDKLAGLAAQQDAVMFRKESNYASSVTRTRTARLSEAPAMVGDLEVPSYLRRKSEQGKDRRDTSRS